MWADAGCEAVFECNDIVNVTCESHAAIGPVFAVCPCVSDPHPPHPGPPGPRPPPTPPPPIPKCAGSPGGVCRNIVFIIDESTDGRTYRPDGFAPTVIPNIRKLADAGVQFDTHYVNAPVCCPSRASLWSGRYPHKIPHQQAANAALTVNGAWNNCASNQPPFPQRRFVPDCTALCECDSTPSVLVQSSPVICVGASTIIPCHLVRC